MSDWSDIVASTERFAPVGERHDVQLVTDLISDADEKGRPTLSVEVHGDDLRLLMAREVAVRDGAAWIAALTSVFDVPPDDLPPPDSWREITDQVLEHRRALDDLPVFDGPRG